MIERLPPNDALTWRPRHDKFFATEEESAAEFDARIASAGEEIFSHNFREVRGYYLTHRPNREEKDARIDRVLLPGPKLKALGWRQPIGVELKKSEAEFGHAISQAIDYTYCNWNVGDYWLYCEKIFVWPFKMPGGPTQSIMIQNGIGACHGRLYSEVYDRASPDLDVALNFSLERNNLEIGTDGQILECVPWRSGTRKGSR